MVSRVGRCSAVKRMRGEKPISQGYLTPWQKTREQNNGGERVTRGGRVDGFRLDLNHAGRGDFVSAGDLSLLELAGTNCVQ